MDRVGHWEHTHQLTIGWNICTHVMCHTSCTADLLACKPADMEYAWYLAVTGGKETVLVSTREGRSPHLFHLMV